MIGMIFRSLFPERGKMIFIGKSINFGKVSFRIKKKDFFKYLFFKFKF